MKENDKKQTARFLPSRLMVTNFALDEDSTVAMSPAVADDNDDNIVDEDEVGLNVTVAVVVAATVVAAALVVEGRASRMDCTERDLTTTIGTRSVERPGLL